MLTDAVPDAFLPKGVKEKALTRAVEHLRDTYRSHGWDDAAWRHGAGSKLN